MDIQKVDMFLMKNSECFPEMSQMCIRERLKDAPDEKMMMLMSMQFNKPMVMLLISVFLGSWGVDRFLLGDTAIGIGKLLTCGGFGVWTIIDWFLISEATREKNYAKLSMFL